MSAERELTQDEIVMMRQAHPCGGRLWRIVSLGCRCQLQCITCGRRIVMSQATVARKTTPWQGATRREGLEST